MKNWLFFLSILFSIFRLHADNFTWGAPAQISNMGVNASDPQIVIDSNGNGTAVWVENGVVNASSFVFSGQKWTGAIAISPSSSGASSPRLAIDAKGNVTAIWVLDGVVQLSTLPLNGSWSSIPTNLSESGASCPDLAVDSSGNTVVVWTRNTLIEAKTYFSNMWGDVAILSTSNSDSPKVAISDQSITVAVWHTSLSPSNVDTVVAATSLLGGSWNSAVSLTTSGVNAAFPEVTIDPFGNATAVWIEYEKPVDIYGNVAMFASTLQYLSQTWTGPYMISSNGMREPSDLILKVKNDLNGNLIALWTLSEDGTSFVIQNAVLQAGKSNWVQQGILPPAYYSVGADIAVSSQGHAVTACMFNQPGDASTISIVETDTYIAGQPIVFWPTAQTVSTGTGNGSPRVAVSLANSQLNGIIIWLNFNGINTTLQTTVGSKPIIGTPQNIALTQTVNSFGVYTEYANQLTWGAASGNINGYMIYRNGIFLTSVAGNILSYTDHNDLPSGPVTYGIAAADSIGAQSQTVTVSLP